MSGITRTARLLRGAVFVLGALGVALGLSWAWRSRPPEPVLYVGGPVLTMDAQRRIVEAIATDGDRIAAVGSRAELMPWAERRGARVVELDGRAVVPGFIDAHGHFPGAGVYAVFADLNSPPIGAVDTIDDLVRILREQAQGTAAGEWVLGLGYDDTLLRERRHPTRADLDRVSTEHPVAASHVSGHLSVVNSRGLEALGFDASTPDPEGGVIRRDGHSGEPSGVLEETATEGLQALLVPSALGALRVVRRAGELYLAAGVTTAQSGFTNPAILSALTLASRIGLIPLRLVVWPDRVTAEEILSGELKPDPQDLWLRIGAVKLIADGSIQGYTGYLSEPYFEPPGDDPDFRGYPRIARAELIELVSRFHAAGLQVAVHGNGDASIDDILDAFEEAQRRVPRADTRPIVIHAQMAREDQLARMKPLGLIPSFFSLHTFYWGDRHRELFMGPERAARMSPARSAQRNGLRFTIHCDAPVVPMEPLRLVWSAVNRRTRSGAVVGAEQRLTAMEALAAVTIDAAYQHFEDGIKGSFEAGKLADLVLLSRSPLEDPETIDEIRVLETVIGGRSAWRAADDD